MPSTFQFQLRVLRLDHNQISGSIMSLPLGPLEIIDLSDNLLTGKLLLLRDACYYCAISPERESAPASMLLTCQWTRIYLCLRVDRCAGPIPTYKSSTLSTLRLANNNFSGALPSDMVLPNLESLSLYRSGLRQTQLNARKQYLPPYLELDTYGSALVASNNPQAPAMKAYV